MELWILAFPNIGIAKFRYSKHWISLFLPFSNIRVVNFGVFKHWNCKFWLFQTLELRILAIPSTGIVNFGFSKHWNSLCWLFQILKNWILGLRNLNFGFSKHCNWILNFCLFQTLEILSFVFSNIGILDFGFFKHWKS